MELPYPLTRGMAMCSGAPAEVHGWAAHDPCLTASRISISIHFNSMAPVSMAPRTVYCSLLGLGEQCLLLSVGQTPGAPEVLLKFGPCFGSKSELFREPGVRLTCHSRHVG